MGWLSRRTDSIRRRWDSLLAIGTMIPTPGFLGSIPYLFIIRMFMLVWILAAYWLVGSENSFGAMTGLVTLALFHGITSLLHSLPMLRFSIRAQHTTILLDTMFISWSYALSGSIESDFYLFYFLPIFAAAEYFRARLALAYLLGVCASCGATILFAAAGFAQQGPVKSIAEALLKVAWPREFLLLSIGILFISVFRLRRTMFYIRNLELEPLLRHNPLELTRIVDAILEEITVNLGFNYATLSLVDRYKNEVRTVQWKNMDVLWLGEWPHDLDSKDIQADVVRTRRTEIVIGWDDRLDPKIYERFGHARLARIFVPIVWRDEVIGTLEAGCEKADHEEILIPSARETIERLAWENADTISQLRPASLLQLAAERTAAYLDADSASIHLFRAEEGIPYLEGSFGKIDAAFLRAHPFASAHHDFKGLNSGARISYVDEDLQFYAPHLYQAGVRTMAIFPLGEKLRGTLCAYYFRRHRITRTDWDLEQYLTKPLQLTINQYELSRNLTESHGRMVAFSKFQRLIQSFSARLGNEYVLDQMVATALFMFNPESIVLYQYFADEERFQTPPVIRGRVRCSVNMDSGIKNDSVLFRLIRERDCLFIRDTRNDLQFRLGEEGTDAVQEFIRQEEITSCAVLVLRDGLESGGDPVGLLFINYRDSHEFGPNEIETMIDLASAGAIAIRTIRSRMVSNRNQSRRNKEQEAFWAIIDYLNRSLREAKIEDVGQFILEKALEITGSSVGDFMWFDKITRKLVMRAAIGEDDKTYLPEMELTEGIIGLAARTGKSILAGDVHASKWSGIYLNQVPSTRAELAVPLFTENGEVFGVLNVESQEAYGLTVDDQRVLEGFAIQTQFACERIEYNRKLRVQIEAMLAVRTIATRLTQGGLEKSLRLVLTGITAGSGLGFSRTMVFLVNEAEDWLEGLIAIGAQSKGEADRNWKKLSNDSAWKNESATGFSAEIVNSVESFSAAIERGEATDSPLSLAMRSVRIDLRALPEGVMKSVVTSGEARILEWNRDDPFRQVLASISAGDRGLAVVLIPLLSVGENRLLGVLAADFRFLYNERLIDETSMQLLPYFSSLSVMAIELYRDRKRLLIAKEDESEKELTASAAHMIGSRITSIDAKVNILDTYTQEQEPYADENLIKRVRELKSGVRKAKSAMNDLVRFISGGHFKFSEVDLADLIRSSVSDGMDIIQFPIELELPEETLVVRGSVDRLSDCLIELFRNSAMAMRSGRERAPKISVSLKADPAIYKGPRFARIEVRDNGQGIPQDSKRRIFKAFNSTQAGSSGLGLAIVRNVVELHGGIIEENGEHGVGACFLIRLPIVADIQSVQALGGYAHGAS